MSNRDWVEEWAKRYDKENEDEKLREDRIFEYIEEIGSPPSYLTKPILLEIADWKASRVKGCVSENDDKFVRDVTDVSLRTKNEKLRLKLPTLLNGVSIGVVSAILYFCFPQQYIVMDWRSWHSLVAFGRLNGEIQRNFDGWKKYNDVCREISKQFGVSLRTLDKALWQYKGGV